VSLIWGCYVPRSGVGRVALRIDTVVNGSFGVVPLRCRSLQRDGSLAKQPTLLLRWARSADRAHFKSMTRFPRGKDREWVRDEEMEGRR
jgi:hypothetical protein